MTGSVQDRERSGARASSGLNSFLDDSLHLHLNETVKKYQTKGCLSLFNHFIDMSPTLMSPFFVEKTCFFPSKTCFSTKNVKF